MVSRIGADHIDSSVVDPVDAIMHLTGGRGFDVATEALGTQQTFEACLRVLRPGGTLSSLGVYSTDSTIPLAAFAAGLGDHRIVTTLCSGGKERMRRLMSGSRQGGSGHGTSCPRAKARIAHCRGPRISRPPPPSMRLKPGSPPR